MALLYAPFTRLTAASSHIAVDWIFGGVLLLVATWAALLAWNAWVHAHALRKEVWQARGLRPGVILLCGVAEPVESERHEADNDPFFAPFVELTITQQGEQRSTKNGRYVQWRETARALKDRPFLLRTDGGAIVRIEPSGRIDLIDRLEPPLRRGAQRSRVAKITPGERVWVRGMLTGASSSAGGPYRGDGTTNAALHTLRPGRDRPLFISSDPVEKEELAAARFHGFFGAALLASLLVCQALIFGSYQALRTRGVAGTARVDGVATWVTHNKNSTTTHWGLILEWVVNGLSFRSREEVNARIAGEYQGGTMEMVAPIVYDPRTPTRISVGTASEVGVSTGEVTLASVLAGGMLFAWLITSQSRRPWWRRKRFDETQPGEL